MKSPYAALLLAAPAGLLMMALPVPAQADHPTICGGLRSEYAPLQNSRNLPQLRRLLTRVDQDGRCPDLRKNIFDRVTELEEAPNIAAPTRVELDCDDRTVARTLATGDAFLITRLQRCRPDVAARAAAWIAANGGSVSGPERLIFNEAVSGSFTESDPVVGDLHYREYRVTLRPSDSIEVTLQSEAQRSLLAIGTGRLPDRFNQRTSADGSPTSQASAVYRVPAEDETGEYIVVVASDEPTAYTLNLHQFRPPPPPAPRQLVFGQPVNGTLSAESARAVDEDYYYDLWSFTGRAGQRVRISMEADEFDAYLVLGRIENGEFRALDYDDDGGDGLDSLILRVLDADGEYLVRARAFSGMGAYSLNVTNIEQGSTERIPLARNANAWMIHGALLPDSAADENFNFYQDFEFRPRRNRHYAASVATSDFRAVIDVGILEGGEVRPLDFHNDDDGERPRLEFSSQGNNRLVLRVRGVDDRTGEFDLTITEIDEPTQRPASAVSEPAVPEPAPSDPPPPGQIDPAAPASAAPEESSPAAQR